MFRTRTATLPEPTRAKFLAAIAAGEDEFDELAGLTEAQLRDSIKELTGNDRAGGQEHRGRPFDVVALAFELLVLLCYRLTYQP